MVDQLELAIAVASRHGFGDVQFKGLVSLLLSGERQRLALVRALMLDSPALLLDEPAGLLNPTSVIKVERLLRERADAGTVIVMVSHAEQVRRLGRRASD